jgi:hypothetical protein
VPYVPRPGLRIVLAASTLVVLALALLGRLQDFSRVTRGIPGWALTAFIVAGLTATVGFATLSLLHYRANLVDAFDDLQASAAELEASRRRGAQQTLMAIMLRSRSGRLSPEDLTAGLQQAVDELRELSHGIYPQLLS